MVYISGVDISRWNNRPDTPQNIDFVKMRGKVDYCFIKASQATYQDRDFTVNWAASKAAGLPRGAYHYLDFTQTAQAQATYFAGLLASDPGELPPVVDWECRVGALGSRAAMTEFLYQFMTSVEWRLNRNVMVYTSPGYWGEFWDGSHADYFAARRLWVAHYGVNNPSIPKPWTHWDVWQYASAKGVGPDYGVESLDIDVDYMTETAWAEMTGEQPEPPKEEHMWKDNAIGLYTKEATWTNTAFNFVIGHAGEGCSEPNPNLKPIELRAASMNQPFMLLWDFAVDYYRKQQYSADEAHWPGLDMDWPYQYFVRALTNRSYKGVMVRVMNPKNDGGNIEDPAFISFAAQQFVARVNGWLTKNRPGTPLIVVTCNDFISRYAPNMNNWAYKYPSCIEQAAVLPLDSSYPQAGDKVKAYISVRPTWEFWSYFKGSTTSLILFNGTPAKLAEFMGTVDTPEPPEPPTPGGEITRLEFDTLKACVDALAKSQTELASRVAELERWRKS